MHRIRHLVVLLFWLVVLVGTACLTIPGLHRADAALYRACAEQPGRPLRLLFPGQDPRTSKTLTPRRMPEYAKVYCTVWDSDLDTSPVPNPKLQELATILNCLATCHGVRHVALSTPLVWDDEENETVHRMLEYSLSSVQFFCIGLQARNAAQAQAIPQVLRDSIIPSECLRGDPSGIPTANMVYPYHLPHPTDHVVTLTPDFVEDELLSREDAQQRRLSLPLLTSWNGAVLPTLPLRVALRCLGLRPSDLQVHFGHSLRLGERIIPLDSHGRTPLGAANATMLPLNEALRSPDNPPTTDKKADAAVVFRPSPSNPPTERGELIAATISCLLAQEHTTYLPCTTPEQAHFLRLTPLQATTAGRVILGILALLALQFLPAMTGLARLTLMIAGLAGIWLLAWLSYRLDLWMSICTWFLCWLELFAALCALAPRRFSPSPTLWD